MDESTMKVIIRQLVKILKDIHKLKIIHRDIKPENILIDSKMNICLADFGLSTDLLDRPLKSVAGTPEYYPLEMLTGEGYDERVDIWNLGVMIYELLVGVPPFGFMNNNLQALKLRIKKMEFQFMER
jgi:serine/threonine protein kinase